MSSKEQSKLLATIQKIAPNLKFTEDYRPDFLKNKATGNNFEIDIYCEELKFGFEYQGGIHFKNIKKFNNDSDSSRLNDVNKFELLDKIFGKIIIIEIFETDLIGDIQLNIANRIKNYAFHYKKFNNQKYKFAINLYLCFKYSIGYGFRCSVSKSFIIFGENRNSIKHSLELKEEKLLYINNKAYRKKLKREDHVTSCSNF